MMRVLEYASAHGETFDPDPIKHAHNAGRRSVGLWLEAEMREASPGGYVTMIKENIDE